MKQFPFITDGIHGDVPINFYPASDSEAGILLQPSPGLDGFSTLTNCTELRGLYSWDNYLYAVVRRGSTSPIFKINTAGTAAEIGEINTSFTGKIQFADNPTQLCINDGVTNWVYTPTSGAVIPVSDADFPGSGGLAYQDSYGLGFEPDTTKWFFSGVYDFTAYDALDFYTQRARNDKIRAIASHRKQVWLFGDKAFEVWYNAGGDNSSVSNPTFALYQDGIYDVGIGAPASLTDMQGAALAFISTRRDFIMTQGIAPQAILNGMFSRALSGYATIADANSFSYVDEGHTFVQLNFPTGDATWVFDATTKLFHKKQSLKDDNITYGRHRANCYAFYNNKHYVGDYSNGKIYEMHQSYYDDNGSNIKRELYTTNINTGINPMRHPPAQLITEGGIGLSGATDPPYIALRYSNDNGNTWSSEIWRDAGKIGEYGRKAVWRRLGSSSKRMYHIAMTDPVLWRVLGIDVLGGT